MKRYLIIMALAALFPLLGHGQQRGTGTGNDRYTLDIGIQPLFGLINCIKPNATIRLGGTRSSVDLSPELYVGSQYDTGSNGDGLNPGDRYSGAGIGLHHHIGFNDKQGRPYLMYGITFRKINVKYNDEGFVPYQDNGLTYYEHGRFTDQLRITSVLTDIGAGVRIFNTNIFYGEAYAAMGYKFSSKKSDQEGYRKYDSFFTSYAYQGFMLLGGIKLGFHIVK